MGTYQSFTHGYLRSRDGTFTTVDPSGPPYVMHECMYHASSFVCHLGKARIMVAVLAVTFSAACLWEKHRSR
ncbi:hypothetical protein QEV83_02875 [Methylocapsa sp. D3K7]|uniref:hypothetical protein n=1 Tax=Methylocapsa sp. D3K7 TaxID=3041435 RepID=UPI00244E6E41|nr:hypothetical protein [Methylocapsa sp. D3K7]WGJ15261.1 hypothetical protein QEV83_02875 [Methylocapsa sp. D3K7]